MNKKTRFSQYLEDDQRAAAKEDHFGLKKVNIRMLTISSVLCEPFGHKSAFNIGLQFFMPDSINRNPHKHHLFVLTPQASL